jgi:hypothetical protein
MEFTQKCLKIFMEMNLCSCKNNRIATVIHTSIYQAHITVTLLVSNQSPQTQFY